MNIQLSADEFAQLGRLIRETKSGNDLHVDFRSRHPDTNPQMTRDVLALDSLLDKLAQIGPGDQLADAPGLVAIQPTIPLSAVRGLALIADHIAPESVRVSLLGAGWKYLDTEEHLQAAFDFLGRLSMFMASTQGGEPFCNECQDWHYEPDGCRAEPTSEPENNLQEARMLAAIAREEAEFQAKHADCKGCHWCSFNEIGLCSWCEKKHAGGWRYCTSDDVEVTDEAKMRQDVKIAASILSGDKIRFSTTRALWPDETAWTCGTCKETLRDPENCTWNEWASETLCGRCFEEAKRQ